MAFAAPGMLAGSDPGSAAFPVSLALDAPLEAGRNHCRSLLPVHQGPVHAPCQGPRRLIVGDVPKVPSYKLSRDSFYPLFVSGMHAGILRGCGNYSCP